MAIKWCWCLFITLKIVIFIIGDNILWNAQIAPDRTIFIIFSQGSPLALELLHIVTGLPTQLLCNLLLDN